MKKHRGAQLHGPAWLIKYYARVLLGVFQKQRRLKGMKDWYPPKKPRLGTYKKPTEWRDDKGRWSKIPLF